MPTLIFQRLMDVPAPSPKIIPEGYQSWVIKEQVCFASAGLAAQENQKATCTLEQRLRRNDNEKVEDCDTCGAYRIGCCVV